MNKTLARLTLLLLLAALSCSCTLFRKNLKDPDISLLKFSVAGGTPLAPRFALRLRIANPNDLRLSIKGLSFTYSIGDEELMNGVSNDIPVIEPYGEAEFTVKGSASLLHALPLIETLQQDPLTRFHYRLTTHIDMAEGWPSSFNVKKEGEIGLLADKKK
ncbi:MAG TPA: LEA type 2 family protein [Pseudomonadales bacterium]|nr:LEA type 2 family protein [Pseudomonadales bacterium]